MQCRICDLDYGPEENMNPANPICQECQLQISQTPGEDDFADQVRWTEEENLLEGGEKI